MDTILFAALVISFALLVTTHVALSLSLARRRPRWRALLALLVPPLAPYWGAEARFRWLSALWVFALAAYVVTRIATSF